VPFIILPAVEWSTALFFVLQVISQSALISKVEPTSTFYISSNREGVSMAPPHFFNPFAFGAELLFTVVAVAFCFAIYYRTKGIYDLTKYEGIRYFRDSFLFFGLSYATRFLFGLMMFSRADLDFFLPHWVLAPLFILPMGYFSTVAIFYLLFSLVWKEFDNRRMLIFGHAVSLMLPAIAFLTESHLILVYLQAALLVFAMGTLFSVRRERKRVTPTRVWYLLVFALWLFSLLSIGPRRDLFRLNIFFQAISLLVFLALYHRISQRIK